MDMTSSAPTECSDKDTVRSMIFLPKMHNLTPKKKLGKYKPTSQE